MTPLLQHVNLVGTALSAVALGILLWQWALARRFPINQRRRAPHASPGVTILKPIKGSDRETRRAVETWFRQDYPGPCEILCCVDADDKTSAELVTDILKAEARLRPPKTESAESFQARLLLCPPGRGTNGKISKLVEGHRQAQHDLLVLSDADIAAPPDLLGQLVAQLQHSDLALCCCLYRLATPVTRAMQWEAVAVNVDFWSQVLQARALHAMDFGLGAVMALPTRWLDKIGGLEPLLDYLADDFQLGNRVHQVGGRIELCPIVVDCLDPPQTWGEVWKHQLRWARTIRVSRPAPYSLSILANLTGIAFLWLMLALILTPLAAEPPDFKLLLIPWMACLLAIGLRTGMANNLQSRFATDPDARAPWWMILVKDLLASAIWVASYFGNRIEWRGQTYRVDRQGRLHHLPQKLKPNVSP